MTETSTKEINWKLLILLCITVGMLILSEELIFAGVSAGIIPNV